MLTMPSLELVAIEEQYQIEHSREVTVACTEFTIQEVMHLEEQFQTLEPSGSKYISIDKFKAFLVPAYLSENLVNQLCSTSKTYSSALTFQEMCILFSMCTRGERRVNFLFLLFATSNTICHEREAMLEKEDAWKMIQAIHISNYTKKKNEIVNGILLKVS